MVRADFEVDTMRTVTTFDSLAIARQLTDAGIERAHADAITDGISRAAEHGEHVTPDAFAAGLATLRTEIASTELRLIRWITGAGAAGAGVVIAAMRLLA